MKIWLLAIASFLTEEEAVKLALERNATLAAMRASESVAAAQLDLARALPQPEFRFSGANLGLDPDTLDVRTTVGLRWAPPRLYDHNLRMSAALARQAGVRAQTREAESNVAVEVRRAFRLAALGQERVRLAEQAIEILRSLLETVRKQVAAGLKDAGEMELAEFRIAEAESALKRARAQASLEAAELRQWIGPHPELTPDQKLFRSPAGLVDKEETKVRAFQTRPDLSRIESLCRQAEASERLARNQRYPWISFVQVTRRTTGIPGRGAWGLQFGVDLPLFRTPAQATARVAAAETAHCRAQKAALEAQVAREVEQTAATMEAAAAELNELERLWAGPAARAVSRIRTAIENGRADKSELHAAEARSLELRSRWLEKRVEYTRLEAELERAAGMAAP